MDFRKPLKIFAEKQAQASLEYFVLFALIALLTIVSFSAFHKQVKQAMGVGMEKNPGLPSELQKGAFQNAAERLIKDR